MLHNQDMRLEHLNTAVSNDLIGPSANYATNNRKNGSNASQHFNHGGNNNQGSFRGRGSGGRGNKPVCQVCGKAGHIAIKCYHRFDLSFQDGETSNTQKQHVSQPSNASSSQAFVASPSSVRDSAWYMDSGATNHVTAELSNLSIQNGYKGNEKLSVGNGSQLVISHIGSTLFLYNLVLKILDL